MRRLFWIMYMAAKCNHMYPYKREAKRDLTTHKRRSHEDEQTRISRC